MSASARRCFGHRFERNVLTAHRDAECEAAILAGNETGRHGHEQVDGAAQERECDEHGDQSVAQDARECIRVGVRKAGESAFKETVDRPCFA